MSVYKHRYIALLRTGSTLFKYIVFVFSLEFSKIRKIKSLGICYLYINMQKKIGNTMKAILVPIITLLTCTVLSVAEHFVLGLNMGDVSLWVANSLLSVVIAFVVTISYESWRYRFVNGIPK